MSFWSPELGLPKNLCHGEEDGIIHTTAALHPLKNIPAFCNQGHQDAIA